jgi:hypothetical protein
MADTRMIPLNQVFCLEELQQRFTYAMAALATPEELIALYDYFGNTAGGLSPEAVAAVQRAAKDPQARAAFEEFSRFAFSLAPEWGASFIGELALVMESEKHNGV